jgi:TonB-linked SusC/RagA family outer membrane protein
MSADSDPPATAAFVHRTVANTSPIKEHRMRTTQGRAAGLPPRMLAFLYTFCLLLLAAAPVAGQAGAITGQVTEGRFGAPVQGASVEVEGTTLATITDEQGRFVLPAVPAGARFVVARHIGYARVRQPVTVPSGGQVTVDFALESAPIALDEVVVTGTPGGTRLRTIGSSVARVNAAEALELSEAPTFTSLLNARAPGLVISQNTGRLGASPTINIRGRSSIGLSNAPLIYIDGVRVNDATGQGAGPIAIGSQGSSVAGRLNDVSPEDIESIEIIKGPAAATIYGTEASAGVIQIITKKGALGQAPRFTLRASNGAIFFRDAESRFPTNYMRNFDGELVPWNAITSEREGGRDLFRTGRAESYSGSISGGTDNLRYYASATYNNEKGIEPHNFTRQFSLHNNLDLALSSKVSLATSLHYVDMDNHLGTDQGLSAMWGQYGHQLLSPVSRGFPLGIPPEVGWALWDNAEKVSRFTSGTTLSYVPTSWMQHRLLVGLDYTGAENQSLERFATPEFAQYMPPTWAAGRISQTLRRQNNLTVDYAGSGRFRLMEGLLSTTSLGVQVARNESATNGLGGMGFPAPGVETVSAASTALPSSQALLVNTTVGAYVQETFGWQDRLFVTAALRVDNNSAFGEDFKWITYPKVDAAWVVTEEPFWRWSETVNMLRVRAAYGESGRAPSAFSALRTFTPVQGPGGTNALAPGTLGNPNLRPERGKEFEVGFETVLLNRLSFDFTYFDKTTVDGIINQAAAPSSGFPGSVPTNLGRVDNSGLEVQATLEALNRPGFGWDITASYAQNEDVIRDLGAASASINSAGTSNQVGYPIGAFFSRVVVSADRHPDTGRSINVLCDDGSGGSVACTQAPYLFVGRALPKHSGAVANTLRVGSNLRFYVLTDFKSGNVRWNVDEQIRCTGAAGAQVCEAWHYPERYSAIDAASVVGNANTLGILSYYYEDASFVKLREVSATYQVPERWRMGLSNAALTIAGRELGTWTPFSGMDPENSGQGIVPPLSRVTASLTFGF